MRQKPKNKQHTKTLRKAKQKDIEKEAQVPYVTFEQLNQHQQLPTSEHLMWKNKSRLHTYTCLFKPLSVRFLLRAAKHSSDTASC